MKLLLLLTVALGGLWGLHGYQRRKAWWEGPNYRAQLERWDRHSPQMKAARLPKIRPLKAVRVTRWALLQRGR